jgi:transposase
MVDILFGEDEVMAKYKPYNYSQRVMIPISLEDQLMPGTLEFAIHTLVEDRMDTSVFEDRYNNDDTGRWGYDPKILLKVVLFGYSRGLISSRKMERACHENITFMALTCGQCPDHSTIAAFVSSMKEELMPLFRDVLLVCGESKLLGGTLFALDGCKVASNASKEWSGKLSDLKRKKEKIEKRVKELLRRQVEADRRGEEEGTGEEPTLLDRRRQIERLKKNAKRIGKFLKGHGMRLGRNGKEVKSNVTDNESANMMTSHGTIQGYNGQALVDSKHQVIVHAEAFGEGQDHYHIGPMMKGARENMEALGHGGDYFEGKKLVADSNYSSPANLRQCKEEDLDAYIPDIRFRTRDPRFATQDRWKSKRTKRFILADFEYQKESDEYVCPNGKRLRSVRRKAIANDVIYRRYLAHYEDCIRCPLKNRCIMGNRIMGRSLSVPIGVTPDNLIKEMEEKIDTERGRNIYHQRIAIAEPVFANLKHGKGLDRFTLKGKVKVNIQWILYCIVHNIGKILNFGFV